VYGLCILVGMASKPIGIRFTEEELAGIDRTRGSAGRGTWVKLICRQAVTARRNFGRSCVLVVKAYGSQAEADADV
jgi:predicted RNA-binding protein YlxR (DUF448 family)